MEEIEEAVATAKEAVADSQACMQRATKAHKSYTEACVAQTRALTTIYHEQAFAHEAIVEANTELQRSTNRVKSDVAFEQRRREDLKKRYHKLKAGEDKLAAGEAALKQRELAIEQRERGVEERERAVEEREGLADTCVPVAQSLLTPSITFSI